jgi:hypothetical protein
MSFDWSQYLNLAKELAGQATIPAEQEARLRDAISRSYYAAFILARNYLRDKQGHSLPKTSDIHRYVWQEFDINPDSRYQLSADIEIKQIMTMIFPYYLRLLLLRSSVLKK